jgi:hypothetical protein
MVNVPLPLFSSLSLCRDQTLSAKAPVWKCEKGLAVFAHQVSAVSRVMQGSRTSFAEACFLLNINSSSRDISPTINKTAA